MRSICASTRILDLSCCHDFVLLQKSRTVAPAYIPLQFKCRISKYRFREDTDPVLLEHCWEVYNSKCPIFPSPLKCLDVLVVLGFASGGMRPSKALRHSTDYVTQPSCIMPSYLRATTSSSLTIEVYFSRYCVSGFPSLCCRVVVLQKASVIQFFGTRNLVSFTVQGLRT